MCCDLVNCKIQTHFLLGHYKQVYYRLEWTIESSSAGVEPDWVVFGQRKTAAPSLQNPEQMLRQHVPVVQMAPCLAYEVVMPVGFGAQHRTGVLHWRSSE
jgi:hypothetical protein